ncbi:MAG: hypothetical protein P9M07_03215 [Candidatus Aceula meridiana]|nr:hypothetical protein [Candidatus Aceula meridiana]
MEIKKILPERLKKRCGISFVEVMTTVVVLSFGLVGIYRAFFTSLDYLNHASYRLHAANFLHNKIELIQRNFQMSNTTNLKDGRDVYPVLINNRKVDFDYESSVENVGSLDGIYKLNVSVSWREGKRDIRISRSVYILNDTPLQGS